MNESRVKIFLYRKFVKKFIKIQLFLKICYSEVNYDQFDMHLMKKKTLVRAINKLIQF